LLSMILGTLVGVDGVCDCGYICGWCVCLLMYMWMVCVFVDGVCVRGCTCGARAVQRGVLCTTKQFQKLSFAINLNSEFSSELTFENCLAGALAVSSL